MLVRWLVARNELDSHEDRELRPRSRNADVRGSLPEQFQLHVDARFIAERCRLQRLHPMRRKYIGKDEPAQTLVASLHKRDKGSISTATVPSE